MISRRPRNLIPSGAYALSGTVCSQDFSQPTAMAPPSLTSGWRSRDRQGPPGVVHRLPGAVATGDETPGGHPGWVRHHRQSESTRALDHVGKGECAHMREYV